MIPARNLQQFEARDKQIVIQSISDVQDGTTGNITPTPSTFATVWASKEPLTAREFIAAAATQMKVTDKFVIDRLAGLLPSMLVVHGTHTYKIEGILESANSSSDLALMVSEVLSG